jgi:alkanesulfonate monooxygenase SsuD/methylene tetrahydromethanopterin reductase-like flavin-dependent oxidoreductase (luciferase family)
MAAPGAGLSAAQRMNLMLRGGAAAASSGGKEQIFEGTPEAAAERIVEFLKEHGFL